MKKIVFGTEGYPLYFYDDATYPPSDDGKEHPGIPGNAVDVTDEQWEDAAQGLLWISQDGVLGSPPPISSTGMSLQDYAAAKRWEREVGGTVWNGWPVLSDRKSQSKIIAEAVAIEKCERVDGDPWKFADGGFRPLTNEQMDDLAAAVRLHVRNSYGIEAQLLAAIASGSITTQAQIDAAFQVKI
ncbi:DUF4376 domain-containing protein [Ochrobactrum soli]|uniref:DUF4376 domain-containing protein n=1 Tax=Brucella/Ochrobactrum group TaxID=2826938 RepID=UPI000EF20424|nr:MULTISPECIES: DUF4376 domain-containing protein [Brucella]MDX4074945.1 DUF4376 domain-containing protein [Brucella sp. NBRC 113783]RLL73920.1 DUF4376 domain-containing protein [[Ochrobactrum] soli]